MSEELKDLIKQARDLKLEINNKSEVLSEVKEKIREFMIDSGIGKFEGVEIRRSFTFDHGLYKMKFPELAKKFIKEETVTTVKDVVDKKAIQKYTPDEYKRCLSENTARLYGL